jgi:predicted GNAT family N-acyltransferase
LERLAVLPPFRGRGIARRLTAAVCGELRDRGATEVRIHAQSYIQTLYASLGFVAEGSEFVEAGIPHVAMGLRWD